MTPPLHALLRCGLLATIAACDPALPSSDPVAEPVEALRPAEQRGVVPESARIADYEIHARLDEAEHQVEGRVRIAWRNRTQRSAAHLPFHLYMNAFRASDTTWMAESGGQHRGETLEASKWGFIDVKGVRLLAKGGSDEAEGTPGAGLELEGLEDRPDAAVELEWAEDADPTTMRVELPEAIGPGETAVVELDFVTKLPEVFARTGYHDDFHMVAQWFPKLGVLEEEAGWQTHTFTLNAEFYADFGNYEVHLDVPAESVIGATGIRVSESAGEEGRALLHYRAEMVHDFAWVSDPQFVEHWGEYQGIRIRQLIQPEHAADAPAHLEAQIQALQSMEARFGPYPWSTITIVHARDGAGGAGGMEYPTLYTTSDIASPPAWIAWAIDEKVSGRFTTIHEFGHQYFQGLFASNEHRQPWLDEGMNTTSNMLVFLDASGDAIPNRTLAHDPPLITIFGQNISVQDFGRLSTMGQVELDPVDQAADRYRKYSGTYGQVVYQKTSAVMHTLRRMVGMAAWDAALARYAKTARFAHPKGEELEAVLVSELGPFAKLEGEEPGGATLPGADAVRLDVQDYLDQALRGTAKVDFGIGTLRNPVTPGSFGWHREQPDSQGGPLVETPLPDAKDEDEDEEVRDAYVRVERRGDFRIPVEVEFEFEDGNLERRWWDGQDRYKVYEFPGRRLARVELDPEGRLILESYRLDNLAFANGKGEDGLAGWAADVFEALALGGWGLAGL